MGNQTRTRLVWADSLKGWLILLVVLGHALQWALGEDGMNNSHLWNWIYSFHMPAFMAVSGWLAYRPGRKTQPAGQLILRRAMQLLVPYFCWSVISTIVHRHQLTSALRNYVLKPDIYFWFLWVLFFIYLLFILVEVASKRFNLNHTVVLLSTALGLVGIMVVTEFRLFGFQYISYYFMFFTFGFLIHQYPLLQTRRMAMLLPCAILWLLLAWWWKMHDLPAWIPALPGVPSSLLSYSYRSITALAAIFFLLNATPLLLDSSRFPNNFAPTLGQWSLGIYTAHLTFITLLRKTLKAWCPSIPDWVFVLLLFFMALAISLAIVWLVMRNKHTARWLMGKL